MFDLCGYCDFDRVKKTDGKKEKIVECAEPLSARQRGVLFMLLQRQGMLDIQSYFAQYHVGKKTMHNDLKTLEKWLQDRQATLHREGEKIAVVVSEQQRRAIHAELAQYHSSTDFLEKRERVERIVSRMLLAVHPVTSIDLCDELCVSKPTILADLETVVKRISEKHLRMESRKGLGYWVSGEEKILRDEIQKRLIRLLSEKEITDVAALFAFASGTNDGSPDDPLRRYFAAADMAPMQDVLHNLLEQSGLEGDVFSLTIALLVIVQRLRTGHPLAVSTPLPDADPNAEPLYALVKRTFDLLDTSYGISYNRTEIWYLLHKFYQYGMHVCGYRDSTVFPLHRTVDQLLRVLKTTPDNHFRVDEALRAELCDYLDLVVRRGKMGMTFYNPLYVRTKATYPKIYMTAETLATIIKKKTGIAMTQDEIGMLALVLVAHDMPQDAARHAILVCDRGSIVARALVRCLQNNIPGLTIVRTMSPFEYMEHPEIETEADFLISTTKLHQTGIPQFCVNPVMDYAELQKIRDYIGGTKTIGVEQEKPQSRQQIEAFLEHLAGGKGNTLEMHDISAYAEHFMVQNSRRLAAADIAAAKEAYSRRIATILAKLCLLAHRAEEICGCRMEPDNLLGLAIHLSLNMVLWENTGLYAESGFRGIEGKDPQLVEAVYDFLDEISEVVGFPLPRTEAIAILQYFKDPSMGSEDV